MLFMQKKVYLYGNLAIEEQMVKYYCIIFILL